MTGTVEEEEEMERDIGRAIRGVPIGPKLLPLLVLGNGIGLIIGVPSGLMFCPFVVGRGGGEFGLSGR